MNIYNYYNNILKEHQNDYAFLTRLEITDHLNGISETEKMTEDQKAHLIFMLSCYWLDNDLQESSLFDITWLAVQNKMEDLKLKDFYEKMDTLV